MLEACLCKAQLGAGQLLSLALVSDVLSQVAHVSVLSVR